MSAIITKCKHTHTHREDEAELLQKIFGGSESEEEEEQEEEEEEEEGDGEPVRSRAKKRRKFSSDTEPTLSEKSRKPPKDVKTEPAEGDDNVASQDDFRTTNSGPLPLVSPVLLQPKITLNKVAVSSHRLPAAVQPPPPKKPMFKTRSLEEEEQLVCGLRADPPDREDIALLRLALGRMKEKGEGLVGGVSWTFHPPDILSRVCLVCVVMCLL